jgi:hypothetical protein
VGLLLGAIATEQDLIALYEAARGAHAALVPQLDPHLSHHREHLTVLKRHFVPGSDGRSRTLPPPRVLSVPGEAGQVLSMLRQAEVRAAAARAADVRAAGPALAQLMASIGVCESGHVATLTKPAAS